LLEIFMFRRIFLVFSLGAASWAVAQEPVGVSEKDFLAEMPVVLSVSRLPQRLDETPGAVTIIDRQMIRLSGARDVADLLRLVPGFRVSGSFESNTPQGSYHTNLADFANHIQVMVDGRSVYSPLLQGGTGPGLQAVALEDIERIEVLRGSNSATYGGRAFLGTINIVTRDTVDTQGIFASVSAGENNIRDAMARVGWGDDQARFRLSVDRRADRGLEGTSGPDLVNRFNFRADVFPNSTDQVQLRVGRNVIDAWAGFAIDPGNAARMRNIDTSFAQVDWRRSLGANEDVAVQYSHTSELLVDEFPYGLDPRIVMDYGGRANSNNLLVQHSVRALDELRLVWGGELRGERVVSRPVFGTNDAIVTNFKRVFTNAEWRLHEQWLLNLGGMFESSALGGDHLSPRAMLNWKFAESQTLRYGVTNAFRPPSLWEKSANVRFYLNGNLVGVEQVARGGVYSERVHVRELGYLGEFAKQRLSLDVRVFEEEVRDSIREGDYNLTVPGVGSFIAKDYANRYDYNMHGVEYQLRWVPWTDGQLAFAQAYVDTGWNDNGNLPTRPISTTSLMFMQRLPDGIDLGLVYSWIDRLNYPGGNLLGSGTESPPVSRTDIRAAKQFRSGSRRGEVALVVQNLGPAYSDFIADFRFRRQAYLMLKLEN
jgi:iron complex outermembrane receptor protein